MLTRYLPTDADWQDRFILRWALGFIAFVLVASVGFLYLVAATGDVGFWQRVVSWIIFGAVIFGLIAINLYLRRDGAEERGREHLRVLRPQLVNAKPARVSIERSVRLEEYRSVVDKLFDGEAPEQTSIRDALGEFRTAWAEQTRRFDSLAVGLTYEAVLILVFGAVVILPVSWWSGGVLVSVSWPPIGASAWALVMAFPYGIELATIAFAVVLTVGEWLYRYWILASLTLLVGAVLIVCLDRETADDLSVTLYPNRPKLVARGAMWVGSIWATGVVFGLLDPRLGVSAAAIVAAIATAYIGVELASRLCDAANLCRRFDDEMSDRLDLDGLELGHDPYLAGDNLADRLDETEQDWRGNPSKPAVAGYLVIRKVWALLGLAFVPLLTAYVINAVGTGQLLAVALEVATAPNHIRLSVLALLVAAALLIRQQYPDIVSQLLLATRRALASSSVRGVAFARGVPVLAVFMVFVAAWPLFGFRVGLVVAFVTGVLTRLLTMAWQASKYRFVEFAARDHGHPRVIVEGVTVEDADGKQIYIASVDGERLAHRNRRALVEIVLSVAEDRLERGELPKTFANYYYQEMSEYGRVDINQVASEYRYDIKSRIRAALRDADDNRLEVEKLDSQMCEEYAEAGYREAVNWLIRHGDLDRRRGEYVLH